MQITYKANVYYTEGTTSFVIPFDYLKKSFIKAETISNTGTQSLTYIEDYSIDGDTLYLKDSLQDDTQLHIYRETPTDSVVDFVDASILRAKHLNVLQLQILHILEESQDSVKINALSYKDVDEVTKVLDAFYHRIINLADPQEEGDATNKLYVDTAVKNVEDTVVNKAVEASVTSAVEEAKKDVVSLATQDVVSYAMEEVRQVIHEALLVDRGTVFTRMSTGELKVLENPLTSLTWGVKTTGEIYPKEEVK